MAVRYDCCRRQAIFELDAIPAHREAALDRDRSWRDKDNDPGMFRTTITFDEQSDGKTVITLRQLHPTKSQRDATIGFGAVEFGYQTLDKLAQHVRKNSKAI